MQDIAPFFIYPLLQFIKDLTAFNDETQEELAEALNSSGSEILTKIRELLQ